MSFKDYKINGIKFEETDGGATCSISQCGITATYPFVKAEYNAPAEYLLMDLDGTTAKSEEFWIYIMEKTVKKITSNPNFSFTDEDIPFVSGFSTIEHLDYCIKKYDIGVNVLSANSVYHEIAEQELNEVLCGRGNADAFKAREGLKDFLLYVKSKGIKIGLATSGLEYKAIPEIVSVFKALNMGDPLEFYDGIMMGGKRKTKGLYGTLGEMAAKPHPYVYAELGAGMGIKDKSRAVVLEDSSAGLISGRLAGYAVIGFKDGNILASGMAEQTYAMVDGFEEVCKLI